MNFSKLSLLAALIVTGTAQAGQQASFHLPFAAKWGDVMLAPGDYKVELPQLGLGERRLKISGQEAQGFVNPTITDVDALTIKPSEKSFLELVKVEGVFVVQKFQSATTNAIFGFKVPKAKHYLQMTERNVERIGVSGI